ncbi:MAG: hypothetical protein R3F14_25625 [Polyangiaceae bacterium]
MCSNPNKADGTTCSDGNACTQSDTCQSGACTGGTPVVCAPLDQCHVAGACNHRHRPLLQPHQGRRDSLQRQQPLHADGHLLRRHLRRLEPRCLPPAPISATPPACAPATGLCSNPNKPNGTACNDSNACTQSDTCQSGACTGANPLSAPPSSRATPPAPATPASASGLNP